MGRLVTARKPCAACSHGKSLHRRHECRATWQARGATFMGNSVITKWCTCAGYVDRGEQS